MIVTWLFNHAVMGRARFMFSTVSTVSTFFTARPWAVFALHRVYLPIFFGFSLRTGSQREQKKIRRSKARFRERSVWVVAWRKCRKISLHTGSKKKKGKATLFIHGLYLKLQACGAVYMKQIQIQIEQKFLLRIPTGGRLTSWLFTKRGGVEFGTTEDKSI